MSKKWFIEQVFYAYSKNSDQRLYSDYIFLFYKNQIISPETKVKCQISMLYRIHKAKIMLYLQVIPCTVGQRKFGSNKKKSKPHKTAIVLKICEYIISFNQYL